MWWACSPRVGPAAGYPAAAVAVLQRPAQSSADLAGATARADDLAVALQPQFAGRITEQQPTLIVGQRLRQMQGGRMVFDIEVHQRRGVLPVRSDSNHTPLLSRYQKFGEICSGTADFRGCELIRLGM